MRIQPLVFVVLAGALLVGACKSTHEEDVKSNMRTQWTTVNADTEATTSAAKSVLEDEELKEVSASSTALDGKASGKKADGTKIDVTIKRKAEKSSEVSVTVGAMGSPTLGANIAKRIKDKAEGR
jgi:hypothetical protein